MIILLAILGFLFILLLVIHMFKLDVLIANIDFEQIDERYRDTVRRRWLIWTEMMIAILFVWSLGFYLYHFYTVVFIIGVFCGVIIYSIGLHYLTKKFKNR
ncbi:hypothetical protein AB2L38_04680 [Staphylococcus pseudintermedius]|uniref:hypothetical protein n=1 Tax=Staphylococcus pseudintermedius TaxID=283734 RepID=UPI003F9E2EBE